MDPDKERKLDSALRGFYAVPRGYIERHPDASLSLGALRIMGNGDPSAPDGRQELKDLFLSLSPAVQNSGAGKQYAQMLESAGTIKPPTAFQL